MERAVQQQRLGHEAEGAHERAAPEERAVLAVRGGKPADFCAQIQMINTSTRRHVRTQSGVRIGFGSLTAGAPGAPSETWGPEGGLRARP